MEDDNTITLSFGTGDFHELLEKYEPGYEEKLRIAMVMEIADLIVSAGKKWQEEKKK